MSTRVHVNEKCFPCRVCPPGCLSGRNTALVSQPALQILPNTSESPGPKLISRRNWAVLAAQSSHLRHSAPRSLLEFCPCDNRTTARWPNSGDATIRIGRYINGHSRFLDRLRPAVSPHPPAEGPAPDWKDDGNDGPKGWRRATSDRRGLSRGLPETWGCPPFRGTQADRPKINSGKRHANL